MAITYNAGTNTVQVTAGTVGVPNTFADIVTADRAGTYTILAVTPPAMNITLDDPIRPVEYRALQITFTLAGTNAGAGDTVDVTGTDAWGNALNDSINVAAGNGAYTTAEYFATITDIDCTGFADGVGTIAGTQAQWGVVWEHIANQSYRGDCDIDVGNGVMATHFQIDNESVILPDHNICAFANATWKIGAPSNTYSKNGTYLYMGKASGYIVDGGTLEIYGSLIDRKHYYPWFESGSVKILNSLIQAQSATAVVVNSSMAYVELSDVYFSDVQQLQLRVTPDVCENVHVEHSKQGVVTIVAGVVAKGISITNYTQCDILVANAGTLSVINPVNAIAAPKINSDGLWIKQQHTCNIHVADKDGANLAAVVVDCEDRFGNPVWAAGTVVTNAAGDIPQQIIDYKKWEDIALTLTTHSPHTFTLSKAGYPTIILEPITVDHPIVWQLEMPDVPAEAVVKTGESYADGSMTGHYIGPQRLITGAVSQGGITGTVTHKRITGVVT